MANILKANKVNLLISSVLFVFWYHSPNFLDTPRINVGARQQSTHTVRTGFLARRASKVLELGHEN
jgi:hypothetical protein